MTGSANCSVSVCFLPVAAGNGPAGLIIGIECLVGGEGLLLEVGFRRMQDEFLRGFAALQRGGELGEHKVAAFVV
jgi:hypothetical protein